MRPASLRARRPQCPRLRSSGPRHSVADMFLRRRAAMRPPARQPPPLLQHTSAEKGGAGHGQHHTRCHIRQLMLHTGKQKKHGGRSGPAVGGQFLTFFLDSRQECLATPRSLSCVRLCSSDLEWYSDRTVVAVPLQSEQQKSKALEKARGRKSA